MWNMFKVDNKDTSSGIFIVNFEQIYAQISCDIRLKNLEVLLTQI